MVTVPLPHLAGLAAAVRVKIDERVPTMGVFASGRLVANPALRRATQRQRPGLRARARAAASGACAPMTGPRAADRLEFNYAHDYIINDILRAALGVASIPAGGLDMPGAREKSAEEIVLEMRRNGNAMSSRTRVWDGAGDDRPDACSGRSRRQAARPAPARAGDVLDDGPRTRDVSRTTPRIRRAAPGDRRARGQGPRPRQGHGGDRGRDARPRQRGRRHPQVVERCAGSIARRGRWPCRPGSKASRPASGPSCAPRAAAPTAATWCMPGRKRQSWMLNVVLDTSGSMTDEIPRALGAIADFCDAAGGR